MNMVKEFKFFVGILPEKVVYYQWDDPRGPEYWTNLVDQEELLRQQRIQQQREQTERMRNYITRSHGGRNRYPNPYARR